MSGKSGLFLLSRKFPPEKFDLFQPCLIDNDEAVDQLLQAPAPSKANRSSNVFLTRRTRSGSASETIPNLCQSLATRKFHFTSRTIVRRPADSVVTCVVARNNEIKLMHSIPSPNGPNAIGLCRLTGLGLRHNFLLALGQILIICLSHARKAACPRCYNRNDFVMTGIDMD